MVLFGLGLLLSCNPGSNLVEDSTSESISRIESLYSPYDSIPIIDLDLNQVGDSILADIAKAIGSHVCDGDTSFGLPLSNGRVILINAKCHAPLIIDCNPRRYDMEILVNSRGRILLDITPVGSPDSIVSRMEWIFPDPENDSRDGVTIKWDHGVAKADLEAVFNAIIDGYVLSCQKWSNKTFGRAIEQLDSHQFDSLRLIRPFEVWLDYGQDEPLEIEGIEDMVVPKGLLD